MNTIVDKVNALDQTKQAIKQSLINKGIAVADSDTFRSYADKLGNLPAGGNTIFDSGCISKWEQGPGSIGIVAGMIKKINLDGLPENTPIDLSFFCQYLGYLQEIVVTKRIQPTSLYSAFTNIGQYSKVTSIIDLSSFDTSQCMNFEVCFSQTPLPKEINISGWVFPSGCLVGGMFQYCNNLKTIHMDGCDFSNIDDIGTCFKNITNLQNMSWPTGIHTNLDISGCQNLTRESCLDLFNKLDTIPSSSPKPMITLHSSVKAKLSADDLKIAQDKNWNFF